MKTGAAIRATAARSYAVTLLFVADVLYRAGERQGRTLGDANIVGLSVLSVLTAVFVAAADVLPVSALGAGWSWALLVLSAMLSPMASFLVLFVVFDAEKGIMDELTDVALLAPLGGMSRRPSPCWWPPGREFRRVDERDLVALILILFLILVLSAARSGERNEVGELGLL